MKIFIEPFFQKMYSQHPLVLVDVGASGGFPPHWSPALKYLNIIGFEPDEREYQVLVKKSGEKIRYLNTALGHRQGEIDFFLTRKQQVSSMFKPNQAFLGQFPEASRFDIVKTVKLKADTLDHQFDMHKIKDVDFLKIDCQGSELAIMEGARKTIQEQVVGVEIEVAYASIYEGQPLFPEVDAFLRDQGFYLFDLKNYFWKRSAGKRLGGQRGQIVAGDALYFRTEDSLAGLIDGLENTEEKKAKVLKVMAASALYGYFDYGAAVFERLKHHFGPAEQRVIEQWFRKSKGFSYFLPTFRGRLTLSRMLFKISEFFRTTHNDWAVMERELGNRQ